MAIAINRIYHPSHRTTDLREVERFFREVFGRHSLPRQSLIMAGIITQPDDFPADYCVFTPVADLYFDSIDPERYVWQGRQAYPSITRSYLDGYGWGVDEGMQEIWNSCQADGIRLTDQWNTIIDGPEMPTASMKKSPLFWTLEEDTGLRYEFYPASSIQSYDHRTTSGWKLPAVSPHDPLGIVRVSHHTVLTNDLDRVLTLLVTILGGEIIAEGIDNPVWGTTSTFVRLAGDVHEFAVPDLDADAPATRSLESRLPLDSYHSIGFLVQDLDKVVAHLGAHGVGILHRSDTAIVTDPADAIGVPWGFYLRQPYERD